MATLLGPIPGDLEEWTEVPPERAGGFLQNWERIGHPEDGFISVANPPTFEEYYAQRLLPAEGEVVLALEDILPKLEALEARIAALESKE